MGGTGSFPVDLLLFGMVAAFLVLRLRGILGRRTGFERPPLPQQPAAPAAAGPATDERAEPVAARDGVALPDPASAVGQALTAMHGVDRTFDPTGFLTGAEAAFRMIITSFAAGDRTMLRRLLADDTFAAFETAIAAREAAGHLQTSELRAIERMTIEAADLHGTTAVITVRIVSDQIAVTRDKDSHIVAGAEAVTEITDLWSFERDLRQQDPTWRLVAARNA